MKSMRKYYICALYCTEEPDNNNTENLVFIGKTYARNPKASFLDHFKGENDDTKDDFGPGENRCIPEFCILEAIKCTGPVAYKHVLAWCHYFEENSFVLLNSTRIADACDILHEDTDAIYQKECAPYTVEEILQRTVALGETSPTKKEDPCFIRPQKRQFNMRVESDVADCFQKYCRDTGLTQNLALNLLLKNAGCREADNAFQSRFAWQEQTIKGLRQELKEVKHANAEKQRTEREKQRSWIDVMQQFVGFIAFLHGEDVMSSSAIKPLSFRRGKSELNMSKYRYPEKNGCAVIYLDALVYGKGVGAPLFVLGHTANRIYFKFRWYPRSQYIGVPPKMEAYATEGSRWVVAYMSAPDGAMDLFAALPLLAISDLKYSCMETDLILDFTYTKMLDGKNF